MDVESVTVELYGLHPSEFTAARDTYAARARTAGDRQLATAITRLRKPTVAAWTAGLLARARPDEAQRLVELGEALRTAHRTLDPEPLRKLSHDQHVVIGRLARTASALAAEAGRPVSEAVLREVEQILHTVLADAEVAAQWREGRLGKTPDPVLGFAGLEPQPGAAPPRPPQAVRRTRPTEAAEPTGPPGSTAARVPPPAPEPRADERAAQAHRKRVEAARAELAEALAEAERLEAAQAAGQELVDRAAAAVTEAEEDVRAAKERLRAARAASTEALARHREAGRAAAKARARADAAARKAEKLTGDEA
ncbi:hypothetical protein ACF059_04235 [Streptomyces sp. NPDC016562]|uniref:hypothetical protein n=1 Tax=Streptomyces sp. NPDC016562 TaxID=3364966 RepID=UPI0036FCE8D4